MPAEGVEFEPIEICRPLLPSAAELMPYLARLDESRMYANRAALARELEARMAQHYAVEAGRVRSAASGSLALVGAILATAGRAHAARPVCLTQALGFVASASAAALCGYDVHFCDVDAESWVLDPVRLAGRPDLERVGLVLPVAPYGREIDLEAWAEFSRTTGIPVVIDAAASGDTLRVPPTLEAHPPVCISLHATKAIASGEGGLVIAPDADVAEACHAALNHGFRGSRTSVAPNTNGKLSEYHAAVGLASMDALETIIADWDRTADAYRACAARMDLPLELFMTPVVSRAYMLARFDDASLRARAQTHLAGRGVSSLLWYGNGLHTEPVFTQCSRDPLPVTERLAGTLLGLPMGRDLARERVERVVHELAGCSREAAA